MACIWNMYYSLKDQGIIKLCLKEASVVQDNGFTVDSPSFFVPIARGEILWGRQDHNNPLWFLFPLLCPPTPPLPLSSTQFFFCSSSSFPLLFSSISLSISVTYTLQYKEPRRFQLRKSSQCSLRHPTSHSVVG